MKVDACFPSREEVVDATKHGYNVGNSVTFSGLLNALDGVAAAEGRVLFMTTNHQQVGCSTPLMTHC